MKIARHTGGRTFACVRRMLFVAGLLAVAIGCARTTVKGPALHRVAMHNIGFEPDSLGVAVGDTVEWTNRDVVPHTATATSGRWDSQVVQPGASWRTVMGAAGSEPYSCVIHTTMHARIDVR